MAKSFSSTRREFLRTTATLFGGAVALPLIIPRSALFAADRPGANDRIGMGYIGVGRRAQQLMALPKEAQFIAVSDAWLPRAEKVAAKLKCKPFHEYRQMLELKDVDAVVIASPDHWHTLHTIHTCQAGKDVYCEKPLTLTIREGRAMVEAVRKYKRVMQTGSQQRSMAPNYHACDLIRKGAIGKVHTIIASNYQSPWYATFAAQPIPQGLNWDAWCGQVEPVPFHEEIFTPRAKPGWISLQPFSGGEMTGWGAHGLDQIQWALSMDESGPTEIWVEGEKFAPPTFDEPHAIADGDAQCNHPTVYFRYANGPVVKLENPKRTGGAVFIGEKGQIQIDRNTYKVEPKELDPKPTHTKEKFTVDPHMQNWFDCMHTRERPVADVEIGHRTTTLCHLGNIARWVGRKMTWDPIKEIFPGDDEANQFLSRPMRKPYQLPEQV